MKNITTRLFSIFISICLIFTACLSQSISVHAEMKSYTWDELKKNTEYFLTWAYSQMGAVFQDHDFYKFIQNEDAWDSYFNEKHVTLNDGSITIDKEFTSWLKQYLINYSKKYQPYYYAWSSGFEEISYGTFGSQKNVRDTVYNVLKTAPSNTIKFGINFGMFNGVYKSYIYIGVFDNLRDIGFVHDNSGNSQLAYHYSYSTWANTLTDIYCVELTAYDDAIVSWESFKNSALCVNQTYDGRSFYKDVPLKELVFCSETERYRISTGFNYNSYIGIVTPTRTTFRIFRESDDLFDYSLDKRGIYFTSDFWDYEPGDITGTLDDLNDSIGRMQDLIDMLLDRIGDNSSESEIEELLRQILEELKNGNGSGDSGGSSGGSDSSKDYSEFFKDILEYLKTINSNTKDILENLKKFKNYVISKDIADFITDLFDDPENSSKETVGKLSSSFGEIAAGLTEKFPFSIPWDIQYILLQLSDTPKTPRYELPLYIKSFGIDEVIVVEMEKFEVLSNLSRTMFSMLFSIYLINLTFKVVGLRKE